MLWTAGGEDAGFFFLGVGYCIDFREKHPEKLFFKHI